jgi:hypothetical protein
MCLHIFYQWWAVTAAVNCNCCGCKQGWQSLHAQMAYVLLSNARRTQLVTCAHHYLRLRLHEDAALFSGI